MPYTEEHFEQMEHDADMRRRFFWTVAQKSILRSHEARAEGHLGDAQFKANFGRAILDNLDLLVESTSE